MTRPVDRWRELRGRLHREVCERGFDAERGTFTQSYGSPTLDAATLMIPIVGFTPPDDPRVIGTVEAVQRELCVDGFLLRYDTRDADDGLPPGEGAFLPCSFWLADCLTLIGRHDEAQALFDRLTGLANDVGLLAEEYDPLYAAARSGTSAGVPHVGLVNSAMNLDRASVSPAESRADREEPRPPDARAITLDPGTPDSADLEELPEPGPEEGAILVDGVALGICGTDAEIVRGDYGEAPPGSDRLILGHESLGRVAEAPEEAASRPATSSWGSSAVPTRCRAVVRGGEWDFCRNGQYTERGIKALHGYGSERWRIEPEFVVTLDPALGQLGVLIEPMTIVAKAWEQIDRVIARATIGPERVLVTVWPDRPARRAPRPAARL